MLGKAWFFFTAGSAVFLYPYLNLFLESRGLSYQELGLLSALRPWVAAVSAVVGTSLADKHNRHRDILVSCLVLSTVVRLSLYFAGTNTLLLFAAILLSDTIASPVGVLADAWVVASANKEGHYGSQRLWASVGWGALSFASGFLLEKHGYGASFLACGLLSIPTFIAASYMQFPSATVKDQIGALKKNDDLAASLLGAEVLAAEGTLRAEDHASTATAAVCLTTPSAKPASMWDRMQDLLQNQEVAFLLAKCVIMGFGTGVIGTFLFIYLKELGSPTSVLGLLLLGNCLAEVPVFHFQSAILSVLSPDATLDLAAAFLVLRLLCYAALPLVPGLMPWVVLPVELLHGATFAASWGAACVQGQRVAPEDKRTTMQGLVQSFYMGLGGGTGALAGTLLYKQLGGQGMFAASALAVAVAGVTVVVAQSGTLKAQKALPQLKQQQQQQNQQQQQPVSALASTAERLADLASAGQEYAQAGGRGASISNGFGTLTHRR